ncbi:MAG TPA: hypothetical protein VK821_06320 [Dehalococcoidia bacterium]|nr:hypothetical protein [Dehalococcoidia bacterium]
MSGDDDAREQVEAIGEAAEALWDATRRFQDQLDELENERYSRWAAYTAFRDIGSVFRFALERLRMEQPVPELEEIVAAYLAGARAGFEAAADLAEAVKDGGAESVETGIQRLTVASQHFVRGRYLLGAYLGKPGADAPV